MYFFLDRESVDQLPYILACLLCHFPAELHADIMQLLCDCILPYTLQGRNAAAAICASEIFTRLNLGENGDSYATHSIPAVLMLVFQYTKEPSEHCRMRVIVDQLRSCV